MAGGSNQPGGAADGEVMLDIEVIGALAPAASIVVYFAPNTDQGFYEAISQAAHDSVHKPSVISISWGEAEDSWAAASRDAMQSALEDAAALGVSVTVAAGDSGSGDGQSDGQPHVDFPASSPYALGCGGTTLTAQEKVLEYMIWDLAQCVPGPPTSTCTGKTCTDLGNPCGQQSDGCGNLIQCATCPAGQTWWLEFSMYQP